VINIPEALLDSEFTRRGRIEHHFYVLRSISVVFIEVKKTLVLGKKKLDVIAQVLAECAACDYANMKSQHWVPVLAILCDGTLFDFLVYDTGCKSVFASTMVTGLVDQSSEPDLFLSSLKRTAEYIFDYFLMGYINGLRSFVNSSELAAAQSKSKKRKSTEIWLDALARAENAHLLCREAAELARGGMYEEAEDTAVRGITELNESVSRMPEVGLQKISVWKEEVAMKA